MIVDGKKIADEIYAALKKERVELSRPPRLGIVVGTDDAATLAYVRLKERIASELSIEVTKETLSPQTTTEHAIAVVQELCRKQTGVVVQLPLPTTIDSQKVLAAIAPRCDVDALNPTIKDFERKVQAPLAEVVDLILTRFNVNTRDANAVVVGQGVLVGIPAAAQLLRRGAKVTTVTRSDGSLETLKDADIVVLGAGSPGLVKPEMLKHGVVLIDAGTSEQGGRMLGDADPACSEVANLFTPVPGGVGPLAVAMLFKNLFVLAHGK